MSATIAEGRMAEDCRGAGDPRLDTLFRELDEEPEGPDVAGPEGPHVAAGPGMSNRAAAKVRSAGRRVTTRAGLVLIATGVVLIACGLLTLSLSLPLFLALNVASLLLIALGVLLLPEGSGRR